MVRVPKDETSVKFLYSRSVLGNGSIPFLIKGASEQLSWVRDSQGTELETRRREEATSETGRKCLLTCAVDMLYEEVNYFLQLLRLLLLLLLLPLRTETSKKLQ